MKKPATSPTGWWIAGLLEKHSRKDRAPFWNNYRLIRADDWKTAFEKATALGQEDARVGNEAFSGRQEFMGISDLVPIYDAFEDGAEILWEELWPEENEPDVLPVRVLSKADLESEYEIPAEPLPAKIPCQPSN